MQFVQGSRAMPPLIVELFKLLEASALSKTCKTWEARAGSLAIQDSMSFRVGMYIYM